MAPSSATPRWVAASSSSTSPCLITRRPSSTSSRSSRAFDKPIDGIGHRVVQGGWYFPESKVVTDETLAWVREVAPLAPLHNYAEADVIEICREMFPENR